MEPEQPSLLYCYSIFGTYTKPNREKIIEILQSITDWHYEKRQYREFNRNKNPRTAEWNEIRIRVPVSHAKTAEVEIIRNIIQPNYYVYKPSITGRDICEVIDNLNFRKINNSYIQQEVRTNRRFMCSVHLHQKTHQNCLEGQQQVIQIKEVGFEEIDRVNGLTTIIANKLGSFIQRIQNTNLMVFRPKQLHRSLDN